MNVLNRLLTKISRQLYRYAWAEDNKIEWTIEQIAPVIAKISKSLNEKTGEQMMDTFWQGIDEKGADKVALLDKYWKSYANLGIPMQYNIPKIISNIKRNNPSISGPKFYGKLKRTLVRYNSPWLQLYYDIYHGKDYKGNPVTLETLKQSYQWKKIEEEAYKTYFPMGRRNKVNSNYTQDAGLTPRVVSTLEKYNDANNKDAANKINSLCIVWNKYNSEFKSDTTDINEMKNIVNKWIRYMNNVYRELSQVPSKYVTIYDTFQIEKFLNDTEHYGGIAKQLARLNTIISSGQRYKGHFNGKYIYWGLQNMYFAAKGEAIRPFDMSVSKESLESQKQYNYEQDTKSSYNANRVKNRVKVNQKYMDKNGYINPLLVLMEKQIFSKEDFVLIEDLDELKSTIEYFKSKLRSLTSKMLLNTTGTIYKFTEENINKLFSDNKYGNINKQIQLMDRLEAEGKLDFKNAFNGLCLWECIENMFADFSGQAVIDLNLPNLEQLINTASSRLKRLRR